MATTTVSSAGHSAAHSKGSLGTYIRYNFGRWLLLLGLFVLSVIMVAPILWTISTSLRTPAQSFSLPPKWLPTDWAWENYASVFDQIPFFREILNSFIVTVGTVMGQLVTASLAGYAFARLEFPGKNGALLASYGDADDPATGNDHPRLRADQPPGAVRYAGLSDSAGAAYCLRHFPAAPVLHADPQGF